MIVADVLVEVYRPTEESHEKSGTVSPSLRAYFSFKSNFDEERIKNFFFESPLNLHWVVVVVNVRDQEKKANKINYVAAPTFYVNIITEQ